jgi:hypothetical protein
VSQIHKSTDKKGKRKLTFEIEKIVKSLKSKDARCNDEISARLLKISSP